MQLKRGVSWVTLGLIVCAMTAVTLLLDGCDRRPVPPQTPSPITDYARFLPYPQATGLALDTKTGLLCHTFNSAIDAVSAGGAKALLPGQHLLDSVPLCIDLSQVEGATVKAQLDLNEQARKNSQREVIEDANGKKWYIFDK